MNLPPLVWAAIGIGVICITGWLAYGTLRQNEGKTPEDEQ